MYLSMSRTQVDTQDANLKKSGALERQRQPLGLPLLCNLGLVSNHSCSVLQRSQ
jgi:hypothetical protein